MTERRLIDDPNTPDAIRSLLKDVPASRPLDRVTFERGRSRLAASVAVSGTLAAVFTLKTIGIAVAATVVAVGSGVGLTMKRELPAEPAALERPPERPAWPPRTPSAPPSVLPPPRPWAPSPPAAASTEPARRLATPKTAATSVDDLSAELQALEEARALARKAPENSLRLLDLHRRDFPAGNMRLEAAVLRVEVLARLGRHGEARALANRIELDEGGSLYSERLKKALAKE